MGIGRGEVARACLALVVTFGAGCATRGESPLRETEGPAHLDVVSSHYNDVNVYLMLDGSWLRLGTVTGLTTERFEIPESALYRPGGFRILAEAIGSSAAYLSSRVLANSGDLVRLQLASVLSMSSWSVGSVRGASPRGERRRR